MAFFAYPGKESRLTPKGLEPISLADGSADPDLFAWDGIHLNAEGYARWAPPIRERLLRDLGTDD